MGLASWFAEGVAAAFTSSAPEIPRTDERRDMGVIHWPAGAGLTASIGMLDSPGPFVGLLAQLVEQRTFNPQQEAPTQGFLNRFGAERSQLGPPRATERRFRHTVCHSRARRTFLRCASV